MIFENFSELHKESDSNYVSPEVYLVAMLMFEIKNELLRRKMKLKSLELRKKNETKVFRIAEKNETKVFRKELNFGHGH